MVSHTFDTCAQGRARTTLLAISLLCASAWTFAMRSGAAGVNSGSAGFEIASAITAAVLVLVTVIGLRGAAGTKTESGDARGDETSAKTASMCAIACGAALCVLTGAKIAAGATTVALVDAASTALVTLLAVLQFAAFRSLGRRDMIIASAAAFAAAAIAAGVLQPETMLQQIAIAALPLVAGVTLAPCLGARREVRESTAAVEEGPAKQDHWDAASERGHLSKGSQAEDAAANEGAHAERKGHRRHISRPAAGFCAMMFILGFAHDNARIGYLSSIPGFGEFSPAAGTITYALVVVAIIGAIAWLSLRTPNGCSSGMKAGYHVAALTLATSQLLPLLPFDPTTHATVILPVHMGVFRGMLFFAWIATLQATGMRKTLLYCASQASLSIGSLAGVGAWDVAHTASASDTFFYPLMLVSTLGLVLAYVVLFTDEDLDALMICNNGAQQSAQSGKVSGNSASEHNAKRFSARCEAVAQAHGLTPRETEIMTMFAKGRNLDYIHTNLVISKSTVSMHRQHIYRKLDVHSQQEMIDLIERCEIKE